MLLEGLYTALALAYHPDQFRAVSVGLIALTTGLQQLLEGCVCAHELAHFRAGHSKFGQARRQLLLKLVTPGMRGRASQLEGCD